MKDVVRYALLSTVLTCAFAASPGSGQNTPTRMIQENEASHWYGVAKLNVAGESWCNAVLVSETEVVTAAHCLYRSKIGKFADAEDVKLEFGLRRDQRVSLHGVVAFSMLSKVVPNTFDNTNWERFSSDLALLRLDAPIPEETAVPFDIRDWQPGESVTVVGYDNDRPYIPSAHEDYVIAPLSDSVAKLDCAISPGLSGAAVVGQSEMEMHPQLLGIISANLIEPTSKESCGALVIRIGSGLEQLRSLPP